MIIAVPYGTDNQQAVRLGDTLRILVNHPHDGNTWAGNVTIRTSFSAAATDDVALSEYEGEKVQGLNWDFSTNYDTASVPLLENTRYLAVAELTSGTKKVEKHTAFHVLPQGR